MKKGWNRKRLGDVLEVQNGFAFDSTRFNPSKGPPLIRIRSLKLGIETETRYGGEYEDKYMVRVGDLLIGMDGEFGCYEWKGEPSLLNQRVCRLQGFSGELLPRFLFYGVNDYLKAIEDVTGFATVKHLSSKQILAIEFPVPPLAEQRRIVGVLDEAFASLATAQAHAAQNLQNARALFECCIQVELGKDVALGELVDIKTGKLDANAAEEDGEYPFFTCSRETYAINNYAFDCEAVLLAGNNAVGDFNVKHYVGKFNAYQRTYVITINSRKRAISRYLYYQLQKNLAKFKSQSVGTGTKFLKLGMIKDMVIPLPTIPEQSRIVNQLDALAAETQRLAQIYEQKLAALAALKKSLLHQAFNGEL
jgi:type I restriction enzyme S subunit